MSIIASSGNIAKLEIKNRVNGELTPFEIKTMEGSTKGVAKYLCFSGPYWVFTNKNVDGEYWYEDENEAKMGESILTTINIHSPNNWNGEQDTPLWLNLLHQINQEHSINLEMVQ